MSFDETLGLTADVFYFILMFKLSNSNQQELLLSCCFFDHASSKINKVWLLLLPSCPFSSTCVTPGISRHTHPKGEPCIYMDGWQVSRELAKRFMFFKMYLESIWRRTWTSPSVKSSVRLLVNVLGGVPPFVKCWRTILQTRHGVSDRGIGGGGKTKEKWRRWWTMNHTKK